MGKFDYTKAFFEKFKDYINPSQLQTPYRPLQWLSLVTNFYNFKSGSCTSAKSIKGYADINILLEKKLKIPSDFVLTIPSDYLGSISLDKSDYLWLYCANIPKMNELFRLLKIEEPTKERKEQIAIAHLLWNYFKIEDGVSNLAFMPIAPIIDKLLDLYKSFSVTDK
ncbi:hypothetical protein HOG98_01940 [bacterium]|nr:hypothetical protein [bacterium]